MLNNKDWSAWISDADGQELPQYKATAEESYSDLPHKSTSHVTPKVSCWIPSSEGKEFSVHVANKSPIPFPCQVSVYMDGSYAYGQVFRTGPFQVKISGRRSPDLRTEAPFLFSRLSLTDDDSALRDVSHLKDLGIIRISIDRIAIVPGPAKPPTSDSRSIAEKGPVHEASKKAGAHCVSYGTAKAIAPTSYINVDFLDKKPFLEFEFRYRSADLLRAQEIIPPAPKVNTKEGNVARPPKRQGTTPAAGPSVSKRAKLENDGTDEVEEEIRALRAKLDALEQRRNKENQGDLRKRPSRKAKVEPLDHSNFIDGEIIDLT